MLVTVFQCCTSSKSQYIRGAHVVPPPTAVLSSPPASRDLNHGVISLLAVVARVWATALLQYSLYIITKILELKPVSR